MAYIYKITNQVNGKVYIGKTNLTIEQRWEYHKKDRNKSEYLARPLYRAIAKYGIDSFSIEQVEECAEQIADEREIYWIDFYQSYKNGYNATLGGDGKRLINYDVVVETFKHLQNQKATAETLGINETTVQYILKSRSIQKRTGQDMAKEMCSLAVNQYDLKGNYLNTYPSIREAARAIGAERWNSHISGVCRGKRKTAAGYRWEYVK